MKCVLTGCRVCFLKEAMVIIARTTTQNISDFAAGHENENILKHGNMLRISCKDKL